MYNLLALEAPGMMALYAVIGFTFVFLGISLLILIFMALGAVMKKVNARKLAKERERKAEKNALRKAPALKAEEEEISPEVVAVISAAIAAYYEGSRRSCGFVLKRIKRI